MNIENREAQIAQQVFNSINDNNVHVVVDVLPEKEGDFTRTSPVKAAISVCYYGADYEHPATTSEISQGEDESYDVIVRSMKLRGQWGVYDLLQKVTVALLGKKLVGTDRIYLKKVGVEERIPDKEWIYRMRFAFRSFVVQADDTVLGPTITSITFNQNIVPE